MKRLTISLLLITLAIASAMSLVMQSARAQNVFVFTATLLPSNEVPPVTNADANASGLAVITINTSDNTVRMDATVNNLAPGSVVGAHIHEGVAGVNGPIRVDTGITAANPGAIVNGTFSVSRTVTSTPAIIQAIIANPAGWYFNVHTILNPGGAVRGQLVRQADTVPPGLAAPTLSEWGAILMTLLFLAAGVYFLVGRGKATALAGASHPAMLSGPAKAIDWSLLAKVTLLVEAAIALALIIMSAGIVDVLGALTSGLLIAFILHLFIGSARRN